MARFRKDGFLSYRWLIDWSPTQAYEEAMVDNIVLEHLRALRTGVDELRVDMRDVKGRLTSLEVSVANLHVDFAGQSARIDRVENRLERIENRLSLRDA